MKKYELTNETIEHEGRTLYRIRALKDFGKIKAGDLGGFIEKEENLSQEGTCWVHGDTFLNRAKVYGDARVYENAQIKGHAEVYGHAQVHGNALVLTLGSVGKKVFGNANVHGNASVFQDAQVYGNAEVCGKASVYDKAQVCGNNKITEGEII